MAKSNQQINKEAGMTDVDSTPAVVAYRVGQLEQTIRDANQAHEARSKETNDKLDRLVDNFVARTDFQGHETRLASLESDRKWIVRLVVGAVVFSLLALVGIGFTTFR